jgi:hypothetical protein
MFKKLVLLFLITSCASTPKKAEVPAVPEAPKEFSRGELILASDLLTKIFDKEMGPLNCVPDTDEAALLLRTIRPRMEVVEDDLSAMVDDGAAVEELITTCDQNCTCGYVDELFREHLVKLSKAQRTTLSKKNSEKELNRCLSFVQSTFCQSELYRTLNEEKSDFSFEPIP